MSGAVLSENSFTELHADIGQYYSQKIQRHGPTPLGVDWPCQPTQELRFIQLLRLCDFKAPFSLNDVGCGYGALLAFLAKRHRGKKVDYLGIDLSPAMIAEARQLWKKRGETEFLVSSLPSRKADYSVASGIFNVKLDHPEALWVRFIEQTLASMRSHSHRGFAVNLLAPLAEGVPGQKELYRAAAPFWAQYCERALDSKVEVLMDYGMREYTLLVRPAAPQA